MRQDAIPPTTEANIKQEYIWYEFALRILWEADLQAIQISEMQERYFPSKVKDTFRMSLHQFRSFLNSLCTQVQHIYLLIDELNWWFYTNAYHETSSLLLRGLQDLVHDLPLTVVITTNWEQPETIDKWVERYGLIPSHPMKFLEKDEIERLIAVRQIEKDGKTTTVIPFTERAKEYLWRITGGWTGLVDLILENVFEDIIDTLTNHTEAPTQTDQAEQRHRLLADINCLQSTVRKLIQEREAILPFYEALESDERSFLQKAVAKSPEYWFRDQTILTFPRRIHNELKEKEKLTLQTLIQKQIIESISHPFRADMRPNSSEHPNLRLRVGLFYLLDDSFWGTFNEA